ncbi:MAG: nucleotide pyrophosphohydrolase [Clostridia bacterium]|nr:nucleotide pyrophosphohydrolase [Clostridia bacterium]
MADLSFSEMQELQAKLQGIYKGQWEAVNPGTGRNKLLWMICELGEVIDIIKKQGDDAIMHDDAVRAHFIEEMADSLMYFNDVLLCYDIKVDDLAEIYRKKMERNFTRWKD